MRETGVARALRALVGLFACGALLLLFVSPAAAQKDKKKKGDAAASNDTAPIIPMGDEQQIDYMISSMLGAWQLGDIDKLHQAYGEDVTVVNGIWAPPVIGWANYLALYQQQRARMQQVRLDRSNTYIKVEGNFGWACYQWDFAATADGQPTVARGQTTLVVAKRNNRWVIVHNHTSLSQGMPSPTTPTNPVNTPPTAPSQSPQP
jgi:ketosteroid isomerase-like protein